MISILNKLETKNFFGKNKLKDIQKILDFRLLCQKQSLKFVLTNGCFDLFHLGHLYFLEEASKLGDQLWVGLNSGKSIKKIKGDYRPIQSDQERIKMLSSFNFIKGIFLFNSSRIDKQILYLFPDIYVKAGDYSIKTLNRKELTAIKKVKSKVVFIPILKGYGTSCIVKKISSLKKN
jgi:rfaE bifunctional protein nucleotidyltransferase chain/domain